jgi:hypothetical protein
MIGGVLVLEKIFIRGFNFFFAQLLGSMIGVKIIIGSKKYFACG